MTTTQNPIISFGTTVKKGDQLDVGSGTTAVMSLVYGKEVVDGAAVTTTVGSGGSMVVDAGGGALGTLVDAGGTIRVEHGGEAAGGTIQGHEIVAGDTDFDTVRSGGLITVQSGGSAENATIAGGTLDASALGAGLGSGTTHFNGSGLLDLNSKNGDPATTITGFANGDAIDIAGIGIKGTSFDYGKTGNEVDFFNASGKEIYSLNLTGASGDHLHLIGDGHGGVELVCFLAGTAIATADGSRAVETLARGDLVRTASGEMRPVRWVGRQTVSTTFGDPLRVLPIRVRAGAIAEGVPARDLFVSPDHALFVGGVLVQAGALVNGTTITRESAAAETLTYYHVELTDHSLILAEGVPAETFIDNIERMAFDNWAEHAALGEDGAPMAEMAHARAKSRRQVPGAVLAAIEARAAALGFGATESVAA